MKYTRTSDCLKCFTIFKGLGVQVRFIERIFIDVDLYAHKAIKLGLVSSFN